MTRRTRVALAGLAASALAFGAAGASSILPTTSATATPYPSTWEAAQYKTFDAKRHATGKAAWHWTTAGGNCCETYVATTASGRLLEYGGSLPYYSDDHGKTWDQVTFTTPLYNGEGAIVAGPAGDIFGIGWDPYTGDHLQAVKYTNHTKTWEVAEAPIKSPFFDREWISYAKGPFTIGTEIYPFATIVRGGGVTKAVELISGDGLTYLTTSIPSQDVGGEPNRFQVPVVKNPDADFWQPYPGTFTVPLNAGGVLLLDNGTDKMGCTAKLNSVTLKWECVELGFDPGQALRQDSRGWLTRIVQDDQTQITLSLSPNGGKTWRNVVLVPPNEGNIEGGIGFFDVKVNGKLGQAVVSTRVDDDAGAGQDVVWRVDIRQPQPKLLKIYDVGLGDINSIIGLTGATADRYDFPSVGLFPDGRIAVSFDDSTTPKNLVRDTVPSADPTGHSPAVAILD